MIGRTSSGRHLQQTFQPCRLDTIHSLGQLWFTKIKKLVDEVSLFHEEILLDRLQMSNEISVIEKELQQSLTGKLMGCQEDWLVMFSVVKISQLVDLRPLGGLVALLDHVQVFTRAEDGVGVSRQE